MISKLLLKNFQGHRNLPVSCGPVTCLIGPTDAGKSSVVRALRWLGTNKPSARSLVRRGTEGASVKCRVDGVTITRASGKENVYQVGKERFLSFGQGVPDAVSSVLNVDGCNFQGQHDAPFWLDLSPGQVAKNLNAVVDLSVIDYCVGASKTEANKQQRAIESHKGRLASLNETKKKLAWVVPAKRELRQIDELAEEIEKQKNNRNRIVGLCEKLDRLNQEDLIWSDLLAIREKMESFHSLIKSRDRLVRLSKKLKTLRKQEKAYQRLVVLKKKQDLIEEKKRNLKRISGLIAKWGDYKKRETALDDKSESLEKVIEDSLKGRCPLCQQKTKTSDL